MKRYTFLLIFFLFSALVSNSAALDLKGKFAFTGGGDLGIPLGDFGDEDKMAAKTGFGFGGNGEYFITDNVAVGGVFHYGSFSTETGELEEYGTDVDVTQTVTQFGAFVEYLFPSGPSLSPYLKLGTGFGKYKFDGNVSAVGVRIDLEGDFDSKLYISAGGGIIYMASPNVALRGELLFNHLATDGAKGDVKLLGMSLEGELDNNIQYLSMFVGISVFFGSR